MNDTEKLFYTCIVFFLKLKYIYSGMNEKYRTEEQTGKAHANRKNNMKKVGHYVSEKKPINKP